MDYASLIPVLIKGMQEQQELIQAQQARLLQLEAAVQVPLLRHGDEGAA